MVDNKMKCKKCNEKCLKNGKRNGIQRYYCKKCKYSFQSHYSNKSYEIEDKQVIKLLKEGCGIRSMSRILEISPTTVISRIKSIAKSIQQPSFIPFGKEYQIDELSTFIKQKITRYHPM